MPPPLKVSIPHHLGRAQAKARIDHGLQRIDSQIAAVSATIEHHWQGDSLQFSAAAMGQVASGRITVLEDLVEVEVTLPGLLSLLGGTLSQRIRQQGRLLLGKK